MIKLTNLVKEIESEHAKERVFDRFLRTVELTPKEKDELIQKYVFIEKASDKVNEAAVEIMRFGRTLSFKTDDKKEKNSNGDTIWVVIRRGIITTVMARNSFQPLSYWWDGLGDVRQKNLYRMKNDFKVVRLFNDKGEPKADADPDEPVNTPVDEGFGATMNTDDLKRHEKKLNKVRQFLKNQHGRMKDYPEMPKTVMGVKWSQLLKKT